jgi:predicted phosphodiesterase
VDDYWVILSFKLIIFFAEGFTVAVYVVILLGNMEITSTTDEAEFMGIRDMIILVRGNASISVS